METLKLGDVFDGGKVGTKQLYQVMDQFPEGFRFIDSTVSDCETHLTRRYEVTAEIEFEFHDGLNPVRTVRKGDQVTRSIGCN